MAPATKSAAFEKAGKLKTKPTQDEFWEVSEFSVCLVLSLELELWLTF